MNNSLAKLTNRVKIEFQRLPLGVPDGIEWMTNDLNGIEEPYKVDESGRFNWDA